MLARFFIGLGEAAYGSVGLAVVLMVFSPTKRASLTGAFMAGGSFGSVLGVFLGGILAVQLGWRWSFGVMAILGLVLVALYAVFVNDRRLARNQHPGNIPTAAADGTVAQRAKLRALVSTPAVICAYIGSGLQLFMAGALFAWLPSYLNRAYHLRPDKAGIAAAGFILLMGVGMIVCGVITDRLTKRVADPQVDGRPGLHARSRSCTLTLGVRAAAGHPAARPHRGRCLLHRRHDGPGGRDGRQPDPRVDPCDRVRHPHPGQQPPRSGRRPARRRCDRRQGRPGRRDEVRPPGVGPRDRRPPHRASGLPEQPAPHRHRRLGLIHTH